MRHGRAATEVMVAHAYDTLTRGNRLGSFGMVHVLRSTRAALAWRVAESSLRGGLRTSDAQRPTKRPQVGRRVVHLHQVAC